MGEMVYNDPLLLFGMSMPRNFQPDHRPLGRGKLILRVVKRVAELELAKRELALQNEEKTKRVAELEQVNNELAIQYEENLGMQERLLHVEKMASMGVLASGVAHDMNNVLGAILGLASAFRETQPEGTPPHRAFETIYKAATRGRELIKGLMAFAHKSVPSRLELNLNAILKEEAEVLARTTQARIQLNLELAPDLRPIIGDASALANAFMNLFINALDAIPDQGILTLCTRNVDKHWTEVVVEDNGTGMPKEVLARAMDPFFTTKGMGKGTGLGLPMVAATVKAHLGQLDVQSEPGQGTRVRMRFPACTAGDIIVESVGAEAVALPEPIGRRETGPLPSSSAREALTVLVVDDEELMRASMQTILDHLGHTVIITRSGEEALRKLEAKFEPDIIIMDINMPGLGGLNTIPLLRSMLPTVPIILSTGRVDQAVVDVVSKYSDVTLLPKPFTVDELARHLGVISS